MEFAIPHEFFRLQAGIPENAINDNEMWQMLRVAAERRRCIGSGRSFVAMQ
jgi:hypothetical protein